jgi:hypothetical protein
MPQFFTVQGRQVEFGPDFRLREQEDGVAVLAGEATVRAFGVGTRLTPGGVAANVYCMCASGTVDRGCTVVVAGNRVFCVEDGCSSCTLVVARAGTREPILKLVGGRLLVEASVPIEEEGKTGLRIRDVAGPDVTVRKIGIKPVREKPGGTTRITCTCAKGGGGCALVVSNNEVRCSNSPGSTCDECSLSVVLE